MSKLFGFMILLFVVPSQGEQRAPGKTTHLTRPPLSHIEPRRERSEMQRHLVPETTYFSKRYWSVGGQGGHVEYREPGLMRELGELYGLNAALYTDIGDSGFFFKPEGALSFGQLVYEGRTQDTPKKKGVPVMTDTSDGLMDLRGLLGGHLSFTSATRLNPYTGLALRYLYDRIEGSGGYRREITYFYLPFGLEFETRASSKIRLAVRLEYDLFVYGQVISYLSDADTDYDDAFNTQTQGYGARSSVQLAYFIEPQLSLYIEPYIHYWDIGDSNVADINAGSLSVYEPHNSSRFYGVMIGFVGHLK